MMTIYLATRNAKKIKELSGIIKASDLKIGIASAMDTSDMPVVEETADSFTGNAKLKAYALKEMIAKNTWILADDSGLMVDAIQGKPGVYSSRYAGADANDTENISKLLRELKSIEGIDRSGRFVCVLVLLGPDGLEKTFEGICEGFIANKPVGENGFGYDPVFIPAGYSQTFGLLGESKKSKISHRAKALNELVSWLQSSIEN